VKSKWIAIALVAALFGGLCFFGGRGCSLAVDPNVVVVVPPKPEPPRPIIQRIKKLIVIRESGTQSDLLARLGESLQGGKGAAWMAEHSIELDWADPGEVDYENKPTPLVAKWREQLEGATLPLLLMIDADGNLLRKATLPADATLDTLQAMVSADDSGEQSFSSQPFVDCDFSEWPQFTPGDTTQKDTFEVGEPEDDPKEPKFGQDLPRGPPADGVVEEESLEPVFEDAIPLIPRDQWPTAIKAIDDAGGSLDLLVSRIYDQGQEGSCVSNATCQSLEIAQAIRRGKKHVIHLSAISLYKRVGGSPGSGSMVSANMREILGRGVLPLKSAENDARFPHTMPNTGFYTKYPAGWEKTAIRFRGHEVFDVRSYDGFITALIRGYPVVYGRDGHSICAVRPVYKNGQLYVKYANSWGNWGDKGYGYDSESKIRRGAGWAFAVRTVVDPGVVHLEVPASDKHEPSYALAP